VAFLTSVDRFYDAIGGLAGYQAACLRLMRGGEQVGAGGAHSAATAATPSTPPTTTRLHRPPGLDLSDASPAAAAAVRAAAAAGLAAGPALAEILPLGGAGDRLGLVCPTNGDPLPAALLPFAGRTLLEGVVRDLQAREYLRWRVVGGAPAPALPLEAGGGEEGAQAWAPPQPASPSSSAPPPPPTPVVVMTSDAKGNHARVEALLAREGWYGRGRDSFRLVRQPLVPLVALAPPGRWLLGGALTPEARPGGHGALWKLMADGGTFDWLAARGRSAALVRQISNPLAGTDATLLALAGVGTARAGGFGFVACPRRPGAAEGVVALREQQAGPRRAFGVTNVEYTEFGREGLRPAATRAAPALPPPDLPANTNVLFVGLAAARAALEGGSGGPPSPSSSSSTPSSSPTLPGLVFNATKAVTFRDAAAGGGAGRGGPPPPLTTVRAGRLECTMQALADHLPCPAEAGTAAPADLGSDPAGAAALAASLPTFAIHAARRQVTSSAKRAAAPGADLADPAALAQTPEGAAADAAANGVALLRSCGVAVPPGADAPGAAGGPAGVSFHWHPALGPLWSVVAQKVRGGSAAPGSELVLDVAEACLTGLRLDGSLLVAADCPLGHWRLAGEGEDGKGDDSGDPSPRLSYSSRCGRVRLSGVTVTNAGVDWDHPASQAWSRRLVRVEAAVITLHGQAEFEAAGCVLAGDLRFEVPPGYRMTVTPDPSSPGGGLRRVLTRLPRAAGGGRAPSWEWDARWGAGGAVVLEMAGEGGASGGPWPRGDATAGGGAAALPAFVHEMAGDLPPVLDPARGPVRLQPPPPAEAGDWVI